ncbi:F-box protein [Roseateles sp. DC23W]|uniref:F-box protein n=1 Tax=Pelomonas dachongensis TaxID=3299029 RepID=A0ABW7EU17_9BURK
MVTQLMTMPKDVLLVILDKMDLTDLWSASQSSKKLQAFASTVWAKGGKDIDVLTKRVRELSDKIDRGGKRVATGRLNMQALAKRAPNFEPADLTNAATKIDKAVLTTTKEMQLFTAWLGQMQTQAAKLRKSAAALDAGPRKELIKQVDALDGEMKSLISTCGTCSADAMQIRETLVKLVKGNGKTLTG